MLVNAKPGKGKHLRIYMVGFVPGVLALFPGYTTTTHSNRDSRRKEKNSISFPVLFFYRAYIGKHFPH